MHQYIIRLLIIYFLLNYFQVRVAFSQECILKNANQMKMIQNPLIFFLFILSILFPEFESNNNLDLPENKSDNPIFFGFH